MPRWVIGLVAIMGVLILGGIAGYDAYYQANYVNTNYAYVTAPYTWVSVTSFGTVKGLQVKNGEHVSQGASLLQLQTANGQTTTIDAPIGGTVGSIGIAPGASVQPREDLMAIVQQGRSTVVADFPESEAHRLAVGQTANVTLSAYPGTTFTGTVSKIGSTTLSELSPLLQVGTFSKERQWVPVTIQVDTGSNTFIPGENAAVRVDV
ncbi:hypothetical protein BXT84_02600 [Sulfobacillus thermotolerans]|uniref:CusB-like beta-barrel domain-containing protein n=1 Tax=Sulfobacillus thermotolerans TaxID=338644 RepID=A0ABN5GXC4_9FIRM|nr:hypothetical protein BXT84_02600 [Sulfobacillus thermotolerans]